MLFLMRKNLFALAVVGLLASCSSNSDKPTSTKPTAAEKAADISAESQGPLGTFFNAYWERVSQLFPMGATAQGDNRFNDQLPNDGTRAFRDTLQTFYSHTLRRLEAFDRAGLSQNDQLSYDVLRYDLATRLDGLKLGITASSEYPGPWQIPFTQFGGLPLTLPQYGSGEGNQPFKTVQDYDAWLGRTKAFPAWADTAIANFRAGMKSGIVLPKALVRKMIPQMRDLVTTAPATSIFYGPIKRMPASFPAADKERLTIAYRAMIERNLVPAYRRLADFLEKEYLPAARSSTGLSAIPQGAADYAYLVKYWTTTDRPSAEIFKTGMQEVARIRGEMEKTKAQVGFKGSLLAFFEHMRTDPKFRPYHNAEEVLAATRAIEQRISPNLKKMFGRTPQTPFEIRQTEAFRAASASAEYNQGSPDGSRPGIYYIPIVDAKQFNVTSGMESTFLHEALPGHHYQISLQQENTALPKFRRFAWYGAMGEGWALYTESLGKELGVYTDPYQYMGALGDEMHRAVRLVVDVAMHTGRMTREEAIRYMMDNEPLSEAGAVAEIERYMAAPAQALSYKTGALFIRELRTRYEKQLGPKFKLAAFHDELLRDGVMPLAVLDRKMAAWAADQR
jgi:uncharacterized protein (DUF885 family)